MRIVISFVLLSLCFVSCDTATENEQSASPKYPIDITVNFHPAFDENSVIKISEIGGIKTFSVLLKNHIRLGDAEDTFYFYNRLLKSDQSRFIDSCMAETFSINIPHREPDHILDGIFFNIIKSSGKDSVFIFSHSPDSIKNKEEFRIALNTISNLKAITHDTLIINYLDDIKGYFQDQKRQRNTPLMKRRELVYNVKYYR